MKSVGPALVLFAALFAIATPGTASAETLSIPADLNGDGVMDKVTVSSIAGNPDEQNLAVKIGRVNYVTRIPMNNSPAGVQLPRITDIDQDGRDEIFVTDSMGANTNGFSVWALDHGLRKVQLTDGTPLRVWEGGGWSAIEGYSCVGTQLVTVGAYMEYPWNEIFVGERVTYDVHGATATEVSRIPVTGPYDAPGFSAAPLTCS
jgi:hypothetical protein